MERRNTGGNGSGIVGAIQSVLPGSAKEALPLPVGGGTSARHRKLPSLADVKNAVPPIALELPDPSSIRFVLLCALWYTSSALSSNTGKAILIQFRYPVTLTFVQFGFVAGYCLLFMSPLVRFSHLRPPSKAILRDTLPMGLFQVGGHIFSSMAISRIPVSTVHTIKALSPLFTVAAYALLFNVRYTAKTYISLLPLTLGVMLACSFDMSASNLIGLACAFGSALVFVSSNIFFKKIMPSPGSASSSSSLGHGSGHKLDKLNLLFYSSSMAFLLMIPIWLCTDLPAFLAASSDPTHVAHPSHAREATHGVPLYLFMNGTVHFGQNIIAFIILASVSPVTYSIASLFKRVAVICIALVWFSQSLHVVQMLGIGLTFFGLWLYHGAKGDVARGEAARRGVEARRDGALPLTRTEEREMDLGAHANAPTPAQLNMNFTDSAQPTWGNTTGTEPNSTLTPARPHFRQNGGAGAGLVIDVRKPGEGDAPDPYPSPPASVDSPPHTATLISPSRA
ncbi:TPT-domain-containing protein [Peniophora sp. CONT]|nr:TPT-domain-containing protein [Peniophora sp. CONT]